MSAAKPTMAEAEAALLHSIAVVTRDRPASEVLGLVFLLVHESAPRVYQAALDHGASPTGGGFALRVVERSPGTDLDAIPADQIAAMICVGDEHKALGIEVAS